MLIKCGQADETFPGKALTIRDAGNYCGTDAGARGLLSVTR